MKHTFTFPLAAFTGCDGDTINVTLDRGFGDFSKRKLRLMGVQAPETTHLAGTPLEREAGRYVTQAVMFWIHRQKSLVVESRQWDKYANRILGNIIGDRDHLTDYLIRHMLVKTWDGTGKITWTPEELHQIILAAQQALETHE